MIKELDYSVVPNRFGHCLNGSCKRADKVLNPQWKQTGKKCTEFLDDTPVKYAYGWSKMFDKLVHEKAVAVKNDLLYGFGRNQFYRLKRHEKPFTPEAQEYVRKIFRKHGLEDEPEYDFCQYEYEWKKD